MANLNPESLTRDTTRNFGEFVVEVISDNIEQFAYCYEGVWASREDISDWVSRFSTELYQYNIEPGERIILEVEHSFDLVVAMLGVLISGGCVVPLDPALPKERRESIISDIEPRIIIGNSLSKEKPPAPEITLQSKENLSTQSNKHSYDENLAFIVYTSGSSGGPKGVEITHQSYTHRMKKIMGFSSPEKEDRDLIWTPSSFIGMLDEFFYPLLCGTAAVIAPSTIRTDAKKFGAFVAREKITIFRITPSLLNSFLSAGIANQLEGIRTVYSSGEKLSADLQRKIYSNIKADIVEFYGATEAPGVAFHEYDRSIDPKDSTICTPQTFANIRIMRSDNSEAAVGEDGEVWVGGCTVANGYFGKPDLTTQKFVIGDNDRWYRTGDLGRLHEGGRIELLGRLSDGEVNINGQRINLLEVRNVLQRQKSIKDASVSIVQTGKSEPMLVAHLLVSNIDEFSRDAIQQALTQSLMRGAIPRFFIPLDEFPLTSNGKIDTQALKRHAENFIAEKANPSNTDTGENAEVYVGEMEGRLTEIWQTVLEKPKVHLDSDFFALGGDSLDAVTLSISIEAEFGIKLPLSAIYEAPTVRQLTKVLTSESGNGGAIALNTMSATSSQTPLFCLHGLFLYRDLANSLNQNIKTYGVYLEEESEAQLNKNHQDVLNIETLALRYMELILCVRPQGPYRLAGFSRGGIIALKVAELLRSAGHEVDFVALLDTNSPMSTLRGLVATLKGIGRALIGRGNKKFGTRDVTNAHYRQAYRVFSKKPHEGNVLLFRAEKSDFGQRRDDLGWSRFIKGSLAVQQVPGDHLSMLAQPNTDTLAKAMSNYVAVVE